jgi:hypothetical protein
MGRHRRIHGSAFAVLVFGSRPQNLYILLLFLDLSAPISLLWSCLHASLWICCVLFDSDLILFALRRLCCLCTMFLEV